MLAECDANLYWKPGVDLAGSDEPITPLGSFAAWRAAGYDRGSVVADPLFVDPAADDYRLSPDSPALGLGFEPIDPAKIGVRAYVRPKAR